MEQTAKAPWLRRSADDHSWGSLGAVFSWPPRSYPCSFCRREFRSAQALGGHMNVHRRDRARLRQSLSPLSPSDEDGLLHENPKIPSSQTTTILKPSSFPLSSLAAAAISPTRFCKDNMTPTTGALSNPAFSNYFSLDGLKAMTNFEKVEEMHEREEEKSENKNNRRLECCDETLPLFVSSESERAAEGFRERDLEVGLDIDLELRLGYSSDKNVLSL